MPLCARAIFSLAGVSGVTFSSLAQCRPVLSPASQNPGEGYAILNYGWEVGS